MKRLAYRFAGARLVFEGVTAVMGVVVAGELAFMLSLLGALAVHIPSEGRARFRQKTSEGKGKSLSPAHLLQLKVLRG